MLLQKYKTKKISGITYLYINNTKQKFRPWLGNLTSFMYDIIMKKNIFPKKFNGSIDIHNKFLAIELSNIHNKNILELATGSGSTSDFLPNDNSYFGSDISDGLLKIASRKFKKKNFDKFELLVCDAQELPFTKNSFDYCICNLSLNFFKDLNKVLAELRRVLVQNGIFLCSVPIPERNNKQSIIRGNLLSESELKKFFEKNSFVFESLDYKNGTLLYFKAMKLN